MAAPSGSIAFADFVADKYYLGSDEVMSSEMFSDVSFVQTGTGLVFSGGTGQTIQMIGGAAAYLMAGSFCVVVELDATSSEAGIPLVVNNDDDSVETYGGVYYTAGSLRRVEVWDYAGSSDRDIADPFGSGSGFGTLKIAANRTNDELALSHNGAAVVSSSVTYAITPASTRVLIGGYEIGDLADDMVIRSITIYPVQDHADLPSLSAP